MRLFTSEEEVNAFLGIEPAGEPDLRWVLPENRDAIIAVNTLFNVHKAHNLANNFEPDWANSNQYKYSAYHLIKRDPDAPAGFGFSHSGCDCWSTSTRVGSRLVVGSSKEALSIAGSFGYLYSRLYFIIPETAGENEKN